MNLEKGTLGNAIRNARLENSLSQEQLAELVGITPTHLKHIESEHRKPSIDVLFHLVGVLHFSLDNLLFPEQDSCREKKLLLNNLLNLCSERDLNITLDLVQSLIKNNTMK